MKTKRQAAYDVTWIPGDGVGPEVALAARRCLEATGVEFAWRECMAGEPAVAKYGTPLPEETIRSVRETRVALKGPITTPIGTGFRSVNVALRKILDLYACVRPCRWYAGVRSPLQQVDLVVIRENTEDLYAGIEFSAGSSEVKSLITQVRRLTDQAIRDDTALSLKPISAAASERIVRYAFEYALGHGRKKVTAVHKANIMKYTDGLFMESARKVAKAYEGRVAFEDRLIDATCMQLILRPHEYDVLVLPNLYGDIVSDLCAGLVGGLGVAPGANMGEDLAVFEAVHGSAPKYRGQNNVNPTAMILSGVMLLRHLGEGEAANRLEAAVAAVLAEGRFVTYDLKARRDDPTAVGTSEMADATIAKLNGEPARASTGGNRAG